MNMKYLLKDLFSSANLKQIRKLCNQNPTKYKKDVKIQETHLYSDLQMC